MNDSDDLVDMYEQEDAPSPNKSLQSLNEQWSPGVEADYGDDEDFLYDMYSGNSSPVPARPETEEERRKRAVRVLGGMKAHGSHTKQISVGDQLIDVPTATYVKLLEEQIREIRRQHRELLSSHTRLVKNFNKLVDETKALRQELDNKIDLR